MKHNLKFNQMSLKQTTSRQIQFECFTQQEFSMLSCLDYLLIDDYYKTDMEAIYKRSVF